MLFNSLIFCVFFPSAFAVYWALWRTGPRGQNIFIIAASYVFYGWWDARFLILIALSSGADFLIGKRLHRSTIQRDRKRWLWISIMTNLGTLGLFKYFNFFVGSAIELLACLDVEINPLTIQVLLPVGISFYTFQTLSYTIDIYRRQLEPTNDVFAFFAFVSFFPQLVAGPIERAKHLLPQFFRGRVFDPVAAADGLRQMLWGFVKKIVVADNLAPIVEQAFSQPGAFNGLGLLLAASLFSIQLYCDFSGYSDIAIGTARLFGVRLTQNFAFPYYARSVRELWRRWHISLSSWFRDYVYIPLGGARTSVHKAVRNIMIVFVVSGLWHGAAWTFVVWGALNGLGTMLPLLRRTKMPKNTVAEGRALPSISEFASMFKVFMFWTLGLVFFRASSLSAALDYLSRIVTGPFGAPQYDTFLGPVSIAVALLVAEWPSRTRRHGLDIAHWAPWARWLSYAALALVILVFGSVESREFVYFQF
ncbi:MAG: MBOAT family O-acyltransferase [Myxococcota bacterium]|nr:MBOAT family O-acyltransferase [Myxococcota bacterium]